jgi:hypothetical protein
MKDLISYSAAGGKSFIRDNVGLLSLSYGHLGYDAM